MLVVFLSVLLAGTAWSLPLELDEILIDVAQADIDVQKFFKALQNSDFASLPAHYATLEAHQSKLKADTEKLKNIKTTQNAKSAQELLTIQLEKLLFKLGGVLPKKEAKQA